MTTSIEQLERLKNLSSAKRALLMKSIREKAAPPAASNAIQRNSSGQGSYPLSFAQQRLWFLDQLEPGSAFYNIPAAVRLSGPLNLAAMEHSVSEIVRRHESLRTVFATEREVPTQIIFPARELSIPVTSLQELPAAERESEARRLIAEEAGRPFDLTRGPLLRVGLLRLEEEEHVVMLTLHHIISDGWSMNVLIREFFKLYEAFSRGAASPLAELPIQYADYALWQRQWLSGGILEKELAYWKEHLAGAPPVLELPTDHPRPAVQTFRGAMQKLRLSKELREKLLLLGRSEDATLFMTLLASFQTLLHRYAGQDDIVIGTPIAGRNRTEVESLIGFFVNTLVLRTDLSGAPTFRQLLRRVRETVLSAHAHQDVPFEKLVEELHPERSLSHSPLFQVMFTLLNAAPSSRDELAGLKLETLRSESHTAKFDLTLQIAESEGELNASLEYNTDLFDEATIRRLLEHYENLLANIVADPDEIITKLPLMSPPERERLLDLCSHTGTNYTPQCLHELFEQQAARTPDAVAVAFQDEALTYRQLNERANQLAHYLQRQGVGPETMVGLMLERSIEMVIGLLGILKAGGAYVPLDPAYPQDRLSFMMEDSQARVLLTGQHLVERLAGCTAQVVCIDADWTAIEKEAEQNRSVQMMPDSLAYVIYTSGSTGKPKGVMVTHSNVANFLVGMDERLLAKQEESATDAEVGTWLAVTSISFDISVLELFWTLARGWRVVIQNDSHSSRLDAASLTTPALSHRVSSRPMEFSLFYFASSESETTSSAQDKYKLLIEGARYADEHGFAAVWTPERHFHAFGGLYPNPSVISASLALITDNIALRAGSVVLPLHPSIRVAEEWAVVDNLSGGRVGVSFASGWHANDFVLSPETYAERQRVMYERIEEVRKLWRGEALTLRDGAGAETEVRTLPRPVQAELPIWVTAAGSVETFRSAGSIGAGLLTHLLGQSVEELGEKVEAYREARREAGHEGEGQVTLMLHTFVGADLEEVRETVRGPFSEYLKSSIGLMKNLAKSFGQDMDSAGFTQDDMDALLAHAFTRYFETSGLFGTPESCLEMVEKLKSIGVDEIACLVDFGIEADEVLANLQYLNEVRLLSNRPQEEAEETDSLLAQLGKYEVTHLQCTPSLAGMLMQDANALNALGGLHKLMLGGEALPLSLAQKLTESLPAELHNMYGPTETTIWSATHQVRRVTDYVPLGRPIANTQIYILNKHLEPQPLGVAGEIFIGGDGVVRGYLERPELTAERFIADPFGRQPGARMYRTGDLGRYLPNGELEFLGRADHQVKIRGHRIEVGEIEVALNEHAAVREAVVIARESAPGEKDLVAYIVPEGTAPAAGEWRRFLKEKLPDYMIPTIFVNLDAMPLTPNGKIDRKALPAPDQSRRELGAEFVAARTPTEELLASIWCDVLRKEQVGVFDNFFELGGHSLLATQLISRVREVFGVELPLRSLFESPTIAGLALSVEQRRSAGHGVEAPPLLPAARDKELPLSFAQQRLWFLHQLEPDNPFYNVPVAVRLRGRLDVTALEQTLSEIIRRHEVLRTTFDNIEGRAAQVINPPENLTLPLTDLSHLEEREAEAVRLANLEAQRPFDLSRGPLLRAQVLRLAEEDHIVLLTMHHIVSDAWSTNLLIGEVGALYKAYLEQQPSPLAELAIQYADFAVWQREWLQGEALEQQLDYWRQQLRGLPVLEVPTDKARPVEQTYKGAHFRFELDEQAAAGLMRLSRQQGATLFMTLLAAFQTLLSRYTSQTDIAVGTPIAGRNRSETEALIGFFINTLVLRTDASGDPTFTELLRRVREVCLGAYAHQDVPFERLVDELQPERDLSRHPLFQVSFNLQNAPLDALELPDLSLDKFSGDAEVSQFDLALEVREVAGRLSGLLQYNTDLFEETTIAAMAGHFERLVTAILADAGQRLSQLPMLGEDERQRLLVEWNDLATTTAPSALPEFAGCVHELFEAQAARTPETVAVECEGERLTYGELNARANQLARHLRRLGVGAETPVGLYIDRSLEMVVGLLGILKAGGAYLPLDPQYPQERLNFMIEDAKVATLLTRSHFIDVLPEIHEEHLVWLDTGWETISTESMENLTGAALPDNLAYIIYTSGSTGQPKGVGISHRVAAEHLTAIRDTFDLDSSDRVLQFASLNFDVSLEQLLPSLLLGAKVVLRDDRLWGASDLARHLQEEKLTVVNFPTAYWHQLAQECAASSELTSAHDLRLVIIGGDMILPEVVRLWQSTPMKNVRLLNAYGPTECAITAATFEIPTGSVYRKLPIGRPTAHRAMYVLDAHGGLVPVGVAGELHIGGPLLARGYLGRADLTADRFIPDPFSREPGARMYRTGDLVRYLPDGNLEFLGRRDNQVKVRGFRIELGEIEAALVEHSSVREAVVLARKDGGAVEKRLVAYVVPREDSVLVLEDVRRHLHEKLPVYMQPAAFVLLEELPLTPNGKVNRRALPAPDETKAVREAVAAEPRSHAEELLAGIWKEVLGLDAIGIHDNFFEVGGDSILSLQIIAKARKAGLQLTPKQVFDYPTITGLAGAAEATVTVSGEQGIVIGEAPLTPVQRRFFEQQQPEPHHFNQAVMLESKEPLNATLLERAVAKLLEHHDALRLRFTQEEGAWRQVNTGSVNVKEVFTRIDFSHLPEAEHKSAIEEAAERVQSSLKLSAGSLVRIVLLDLGVDRPSRLLLVIHHLLIDGVSWRILLEDLQKLYAQLSNAQQMELEPKTTSFKRWAEQLSEHALAQQELRAESAYWLTPERSAAASLPVDNTSGNNTIGASQTFTTTLTVAETTALLQEVPRAYHTQINDVLLTALAQSLSRWTKRRSILVDLEGHGREELFDSTDVSRTVGWFTSIFPVLLEVGEQAQPGDDLKSIKEQLRAVPQRGIGYGLLRYLSGDAEVSAQLGAMPQAEVVFNYLGQFDQTLSESSPFGLAQESSGHDQSAHNLRQHLLEVNASVAGGQLRINWTFSEEFHHPSTIEKVASHYSEALRALIEQCSTATGAHYTVSDFALADLDQLTLERLLTAYPETEDIYTLSPTQQGILFHTLYSPGEGEYVGHIVWTFHGELNVEALAQAARQVIEQHPILRTRFIWEGVRQPLQLVDRQATLSITEEDWREMGEAAQTTRFDDLLAQDRRTGFDLTRAPLMRLHLVRLSAQSYKFVWSHHHLLLDGWSHSQVLKEVLLTYQALSTTGQLPQPGPAPRPYRDYIAWLRRQQARLGAKAEQWWRNYLQGFTVPTRVSVERGPTAGVTAAANSFGESKHALSVEATAALKQCAARERVTLNTVVQGAWAILLARYSGEGEVVFGTTVAGRPADLAGVEQMVGLFINTLPVRVEVERREQESVGAWLRRMQSEQAQMREYEHVPLVEVQRWSEVGAGRQLFDYLFVFENYPVDDVLSRQSEGLFIDDVKSIERPHYPLALVAGPSGEQLALHLIYDESRFEQEVIERMLRHLDRLLEAMAGNTEQSLDRLQMLDSQERHLLLSEWNATASDYPRRQSLHELFEEQAAQTPDALALIFDERRLTYAELNGRANQLAHYLREQGVGPEVPVGVMLERSPELIIALLGVLKAGGYYVPLDSQYPQERISFMLEDARVAVLLTDARQAANLPSHTALVVRVDADAQEIARHGAQNPPVLSAPENLAYVIYTSGSTGRPKGVSVPQRAVVRLVKETNFAELGSDEVILQFAPVSFDASTLEIWGSLLNGARLVIMPSRQSSLEELGRALVRHQVTTLWLTAGLFHLMVEERLEDLQGVRQLLAGGDVLSVPHVKRVLTRLPGIKVINGYGPTENTTFTCCYTMTDESQIGQTVSIGRPIANTQIFVLDERMQPVPVGVAGELYIGGDGLARDYLRRPSLTAEKFVPHPFSAEPGARLYRTGDLVRYLPDGNVEFLGRRDNQVKVRGFRIELGEIESAIGRYAGVRDVVVLALGEGAGDKRLTAYVVPEDADAFNTGELRRHLKDLVPEYMLPQAFVILSELPLTPNGKVDRRALPAPDDARPQPEETFVAARTPLEEVVCRIWQEVLGVERVGAHDNFFELGGHSLSATQVVSRLREALQVELPLHTFFSAPTVAEVAVAAERLQAERETPQLPAITRRERRTDAPLSFAQQRLWFLDQLQPASPFYNIPVAVRLKGQLEAGALEQTLNEIISRHEVLRTVFAAEGGTPVQVIMPSMKLTIPLIDLAGLPASVREVEARQLITEEARRPFDLAQSPLVRATLLRLEADEHILLMTMHHVVSDGWSMGVAVREVAALYKALVAGEASPLEALPVQYADYAAWQRESLTGEALKAQLDYWQQQLKGAATLRLPTDKPRPEEQTFNGAYEPVVIPQDLSAALKALGEREGVTLFMTLLAAYNTLLSYYARQDDISIGTDIANRNRREIEGLIGFFINQLVLRTDLSGNPSFAELLRRVRATTLGAYAHQEMPFELLVDALKVERSLKQSALFQVKLVLQNTPQQALELPGLTLHPIEIDYIPAKFDLTLLLTETPEGIVGNFEYNTDLFAASTINRLAKLFGELLRSVAAQPEAQLETLKEKMMELDQQDKAAEKSRRADLNRQKLKNIKPRRMSVKPEELVRRDALQTGGTLPLVIQPLDGGVDLIGWVNAHRLAVETDLVRHGAILFRGFEIDLQTEFEKFAQGICSELFEENGEHPRGLVSGKVYTPVFYPPDQHLLWHNENSFNYRWPTKIMFACVQPPNEGGETPIVDSSQVFERLDAKIKERFVERQIMYVRNYSRALGLDWQTVFQTTDRAVVEQYCRQTNMQFEWKEDGQLRTRCVRPAVIRHPASDVLTWFNQAQHWHVSCLDPATRDSVRSLFREEDFPRHCYYGDGSPIEDSVMTEILGVYQELEVSFPWQKSDILVLDNLLTAHARNRFKGERKLLVAMGDMLSYMDVTAAGATMPGQ